MVFIEKPRVKEGLEASAQVDIYQERKHMSVEKMG